MIRNKKGVMVGQIFVFLLAIILFGMVLLYGYKAVKVLGEKSQETAFLEFKGSMQTAFRTSIMDYGSVKKFKLNLPSDYDEICFIDAEKILPKLNDLMKKSPLIYNALDTGTDQNVFLIPMASTPLKVEKLDISGGFICFENTGVGITLRLEGKGDSVGIEQWQ